jgi:hypothetical protein
MLAATITPSAVSLSAGRLQFRDLCDVAVRFRSVAPVSTEAHAIFPAHLISAEMALPALTKDEFMVFETSPAPFGETRR